MPAGQIVPFLLQISYVSQSYISRDTCLLVIYIDMTARSNHPSLTPSTTPSCDPHPLGWNCCPFGLLYLALAIGRPTWINRPGAFWRIHVGHRPWGDC